MEYVLICQSLFVRINRSDELSVVNCTWKYFVLDCADSKNLL